MMLGISWLAEDLLALQEGLCSMELVSITESLKLWRPLQYLLLIQYVCPVMICTDWNILRLIKEQEDLIRCSLMAFGYM